jgi:hypothetical protein
MSLRLPPLPVGGWQVTLRPADGADDLLLQEAEGSPVLVAQALLTRLATLEDGATLDWNQVAVTDFEVLLLQLRLWTIGPVADCTLACPHAGCGARLSIPFRVLDYLDDIRSRTPRGVERDPRRPAWFSLGATSFRLPTVGDQAAVIGRKNAGRRLAERCLEPATLRGAERARVERAMSLLAPEVSRPLEGQCPVCGQTVSAFFHVPAFVVTELRRASAGILDEVHWIAKIYHWSESSILALPRRRRQKYAERARREYQEAV